MEKINVFCIFSRHLSTLRHHSTGKFSKGDFFLFYIVPVLIAVFASHYLNGNFLYSITSELITFFSILGGFMLNLLVLVYGFDIQKFKNPDLAAKVLRETTANISYLITLASIVILVLFAIKIASYVNGGFTLVAYGYDIIFYIKQFLTVAIVSSLINFSLTIFMVLRRFYGLDYNLKQIL